MWQQLFLRSLAPHSLEGAPLCFISSDVIVCRHFLSLMPCEMPCAWAILGSLYVLKPCKNDHYLWKLKAISCPLHREKGREDLQGHFLSSFISKTFIFVRLDATVALQENDVESPAAKT